jgi:hypothetical protein
MILVLAVLACGDDATTGPEQDVELDQEFTIALGERAAVQSTGLRITFAHVLEDSRCPPWAYCVWAGNAKVTLDIERAGEGAEFFNVCTHLNSCAGTVTLDPYEVELVGVEPLSMPRSALEYRVTLRVTAN